MARVRERNLDDKIVLAIVEVLDGWSGRLSWIALIGTVQRRMGLTYTRQTLHRHERIRKAFEARKSALLGQAKERRHEAMPPELRAALDRIARLESENQRLAYENNNLLEQFARWTYNAQTRNLTVTFLNGPLPGVDREQSDRMYSPGKVAASKQKQRFKR